MRFDKNYPKQDYSDIIHMSHPISKKHPRMSMIDRAAQFSPFAALSGHGSAINETARLTKERIELDELEKEVISKKLDVISNYMGDDHIYMITHYVADEKKAGGSYNLHSGTIKKIDYYNRTLIFSDDKIVIFDDIIGIEGDIFNRIVD